MEYDSCTYHLQYSYTLKTSKYIQEKKKFLLAYLATEMGTIEKLKFPFRSFFLLGGVSYFFIYVQTWLHVWHRYSLTIKLKKILQTLNYSLKFMRHSLSIFVYNVFEVIFFSHSISLDETIKGVDIWMDILL